MVRVSHAGLIVVCGDSAKGRKNIVREKQGNARKDGAIEAGHSQLAQGGRLLGDNILSDAIETDARLVYEVWTNSVCPAQSCQAVVGRRGLTAPQVPSTFTAQRVKRFGVGPEKALGNAVPSSEVFVDIGVELILRKLQRARKAEVPKLPRSSVPARNQKTTILAGKIEQG